MAHPKTWFLIGLLYCTQPIQACISDNCLRAVVASAFPTRHGSADCASYFGVTVTPSVTTISPSAIPTYASPCGGSSRYSSACSCVGATHSTTTVTPTSTCANPEPTFILELADSGIVLDRIPLDGTFGNLDTGDGNIIGFNGDDITQAVLLSLNLEGNLVIDEVNEIGYRDEGQFYELVHFDTPANVAGSGVPLVCSIGDGTLECAAGVSNILQLCPGFAVTNDVWISNVTREGCVNPTFKVIPVCSVPT